MLPVEVAPMDTVPAPVPSTVSEPVPVIAVPDTARLFTAVAVRVPPDTLPPLKVPALRVPPEIVAPLMVELALSAPFTSTLNLLVLALRRSIRLPVADTLLLLAKISA
jgi:hypothetical protein